MDIGLVYGWMYRGRNGHVLSVLWVSILFLLPHQGSTRTELKKFRSCNDVIDLTKYEGLEQGEVELIIRQADSSNTRVSCDIKLLAGVGRHLMFYFTEMYLGSPNKTEARIDKACIEPRDVNGPYESTPTGMRAIICSRTEVGIWDRVYSTMGSDLSIRFYRNRGYAITAHYKMVFTAFRQGSCRTSERKCNNDRCIAHEIVCNDHNPCGDYSDCPTGLEHLSSLQMSGIVVLALLSGGIIIIMATVCLQRAGGKRYDLDDLPVTSVNGSVPTDHVTAETADVEKGGNHRQSPCGSEKGKKPPTDRNSQYSLAHSHKSENGQSNGQSSQKHYTKSSENHHSLGGDREMLIKTGSKHSVSSSDELLPTEHDPTAVTLPLLDTSFDRPMDKDFKGSGQNLQQGTCIVSVNNCKEGLSEFDPGTYSKQPTLSPSVHQPISSSDVFNLSAHSLLFTDSDSGAEEERYSKTMFDRKRKKRDVYPMTSLTTSASHNGALSNTSHPFSDFKPPPPPYGASQKKPSALDKISNDAITSR